MSNETLYFSICGKCIAVDTYDADIKQALLTLFAAHRVESCDASLRYGVARAADGFVVDTGHTQTAVADLGALLFFIDKDLTLALQRLRAAWYFVHAGVVARGDQATLLVGASGAGKSTLTWALLHAGLRYLSDELAPIELETLRVHAYSRALALKREPPAPYTLPLDTLRTDDALYVPVTPAPLATVASAALARVVFVQYEAGHHAPRVQRVSAGAATARLYAQALNPLAHRGDGLAAAAHIARTLPCFELHGANLEQTARLVATLDAA